MTVVTRRTERALGALVAIVLTFGAVPAVLLAVSRSRFGSGWPLAGVPAVWRWDRAAIGRAASEPLSDGIVTDLLVRSCLVLAWVAVGVILLTTVAETGHMVRYRGIGLPSMRGLGWAQGVARVIATGLIALAPLHAPRVSIASVIGETGRYELDLPVDAAPVVGATESGPRAPPPADSGPVAHDTVHVVGRGESVYSIASSLAGGDPAETVAIAEAILDANLGRTMPGGGRFTNPAYIEIGWQLTIPGDVVATADGPDGARSHVVVPGDTLSSIARNRLGDADAWPVIWEANAGDDMGGGRTFDDPDLILPGWELDVPPDNGSDDDPRRPAGTDAPDHVSAPPAVTDPTRTTVDGAGPASSTNGGAGTSGASGTSSATADPTTTSDPSDVPKNTADVPGDTSDAPGDATRSPNHGPDERVASTSTASAQGSQFQAVPVPAQEVGVPPPTGTTTTVATLDAGGPDNDAGIGTGPSAPSPIRIEHAAMLAGGVLAIVAVRRRQRLRAARPRSRVPEPRSSASAMERRLRLVDPGERAQRVDVALRAAASKLAGVGCQVGLVTVAPDGAVAIRLTGDATLPSPWTGQGASWELPASTPIELVSDAARLVGAPCVALAQLGVTPDGRDVLVDLEACPTLRVEGAHNATDDIVTGMSTALAASPYAEVAHLIAVSVPDSAFLGHRNAHRAESADAAIELATALVGAGRADLEPSFALRSMRTGGEVWEPAVVLLRAADVGAAVAREVPGLATGGGIAIVAAGEDGSAAPGACRLRNTDDGWTFDGFGTTLALAPVGISADELGEIDQLLGDASAPLLEPDGDPPPGRNDEHGPAPEPDPFVAMPHAIVVGLLGEVRVADVEGRSGAFERSKTVELIAWLTTHRDRSTRTAARTALWELDVRDATFANVVSEARRALARLVTPPDGEEWLERTLTEQLPLHELVVTDAQLIEQRLAAARLQPPDQAIETLRPAVESIRGMPFAGTSYLWPDAEGLTSSLVLLAIGASAELAGHALSVGDIDTVFWATGRGLTVLPGHEELIALRMRARARAGDLAGVRQEWESYERVIVADAWSDGEPAPQLLELRRELLS